MSLCLLSLLLKKHLAKHLAVWSFSVTEAPLNPHPLSWCTNETKLLFSQGIKDKSLLCSQITQPILLTSDTKPNWVYVRAILILTWYVGITDLQTSACLLLCSRHPLYVRACRSGQRAGGPKDIQTTSKSKH